MHARWVALAAVVVAGCASLSQEIATRPPQGRMPAEVAQDRKQCETYAESQPRDHNAHYRSCMIARGYAANVSMNELDWTVGVMQTRPHNTATVLDDMRECDRRADNAKASDVVSLPAEQEASSVTGLPGAQRPNARRVLLGCLTERGYAVVPWVRINP